MFSERNEGNLGISTATATVSGGRPMQQTAIPHGTSSEFIEPRFARRRRVGATLLMLMSATALFAGIWGYRASAPDASHSGPTSRFASRVDGGIAQVNQVIPESMAPMQLGKFAAMGMNMSGTVMDMTPEGYRRFTVELTLTANSRGGVQIAADGYVVTGLGMESTKPYRHSFETGVVPNGMSVTGTIVYQVPIKASQMALVLPGAERAIPLALGPADDGTMDSMMSTDSMPMDNAPTDGGTTDDGATQDQPKN